MKKLPELTALFWITKIIATTLGETAGDLISMTLNVGYAVSSMILFGVFIGIVSIQLSLKKYVPFVYWFVVLATSTSGTTMSDYMDRTLGMGYAMGSLHLMGLLLIILLIWKLSEKSLSVTNIITRKSELFYWTAILFSNTLGTALGDYLADDSGLGFGGGAILIGSILVILILAHYYTKLSSIFLFWAAFILTRPFGATFGDLLTKSTIKGGLDYGTKGASLILFSLLLLLIIIEMKQLNKRNILGKLDV